MLTCVQPAPWCLEGATKTSTWCWCARTSRVSTLALSTTSLSATTLARSQSPQESIPARAAGASPSLRSSTRCGMAAKKVTIVHKANILKALTGLFLEVAREVGKSYEGRLQVDERIVDACAMGLVLNPWQFDVIVTTNLFGDILSDEMAGLVGGLGVAPAANIGVDAAIFEAVHGSAPDLAGKGIANPLALLLAATMMLDHVNQSELAHQLLKAIYQTLNEDMVRTSDLGGTASTKEFAQAIVGRLNPKAEAKR